MPDKRPEPHFFFRSAECAKGIGYYEDRYFANWRGQAAVGEASTSYVFGIDVPSRIKALLPGVRLICMLRNPIERTFSGYWHTVASGLEKLSFEEAIASEAKRKAELAGTTLGELAPYAYVERGLYYQQLSRWFQLFDPVSLKIVLFDDVVAEPRRVLAETARFLDIDPDRFPDREFGKENTSVPPGAAMTPELHRSLAETFRTDVTALGALLGRDLSHWLAGPNR
jgi:hypothetical protein